MSIENNIKKEPEDLSPEDENIIAVDEKLEELIALLAKSTINGDAASYFKQQFDHALKLANKDHVPGHELHDEVGILLPNSQYNKNRLKRYLRGEKITNIVFIIIGLTMIIMGFGMIIIPAPPFFEMFTIYYFNRNDGITIMDLISLLIILSGIYFLIKGIYPNPNRRKLNITSFKKTL